MSVKTIKLAKYESLPVFYDNDGDFDKNLQLEVGDYFLMREPDENMEVGDYVSVYEVIKVKERGWESKVAVIKID